MPIVPAAILIDLAVGGKPGIRPGADCGYKAAAAASAGPVAEGSGIGDHSIRSSQPVCPATSMSTFELAEIPASWSRTPTAILLAPLLISSSSA